MNAMIYENKKEKALSHEKEKKNTFSMVGCSLYTFDRRVSKKKVVVFFIYFKVIWLNLI